MNNDETIYTRNLSHYERISGLSIQNWDVD